MQEFETIIVGAGPAGLIAGQYLKNAIILEQRELIGRPVQCVGISVHSLKRQGIEPNLDWAKTTTYKVERIMPNGKIIGKEKEKPLGYVVEKSSFEKYLASRIKAQLILATKVIDIKKNQRYWQLTTSTGKIYQSKYVIVAEGYKSIIRRVVFPETEKYLEVESAVEYSIEFKNSINEKTVKIYLDNQIIKNGYAWIFPTSQYSANIGAGGSTENSIVLLEKFLQEKVLSSFEKYEIKIKTIGKTSHRRKFFNCFKENIFLVGDAAGLNDPIFKAGTNQAMISAKVACQCILKNKPANYKKIVGKFPFAKKEVAQAAQKFYTLENQTFNELGDILKNKSFSSVKNPFIFLRLLTKKNIRRNLLNILFFLKVWQKTKKWLW